MTLDIIAHEAALATAAQKKEIVLDNCRALDDILAEQGCICTVANTFGFPGDANGKGPNCQCRRNVSSIPGLGRFLGEGNGNPLQYSCLKNPMDRGAWWATVHRITKSWTRLK